MEITKNIINLFCDFHWVPICSCELKKGTFDLKTWIRKLNQNKNRATTFWKASLDSKWLLMRVTAGSLKVNTSLAKLVSRQHLFLIGQDFLTRLENWSKSNTIGMVPSFIFWRLAVSEWPCWFLTRKTEGLCFLQSPSPPPLSHLCCFT